jgi:hypothetical protein
MHLKVGRIYGFVFTQIVLIEGFVLFPHKKCIEKIVENMRKTLHHTYYVQVKFVRFFQSTSLIHF